ncbi:hypothetical protein NC651_020477 [Populus alba x Populus x berolinensis]|nr:hypothetical protein NC651_020477 [Populus alba x Populus x berolinensis]
MPCNNNTNFLCQANHPLSQTPKPSPSPKRETITYGKLFRLFRGLLKEFTFCGSFYCLMPLSVRWSLDSAGWLLIAIGGAACLISVLWALFGRMDGDFGSVTDRWAVAGVGEYLQNAQKSKVDVVRYLRFVPVVGLFAYLLCLNLDEELWPNIPVCVLPLLKGIC